MTTGKQQIAWKDRLLPTTTVHPGRWQFFQPTRYPVDCTRPITKPGAEEREIIGTITGRLGVMHALFLEVVCFYAERTKIIEGGSLQILVDPYQIRKTMGRTNKGGYSAEGIEVLTENLRRAALRFHSGSRGGGLPDIDGILDRIESSPRTRTHPITGKERPLKRVVLSPTYRSWLENDLKLHYDPSPLADLRHGVSAALARLVLTHRDQPVGGWKIDGLIEAVGAQATRRNRQLVREDADGLGAAGIVIDGGRVLRGVPATPAGVPATPAPYPLRQRAYPPRQRE